jgi:hypothetical protein
MRLDRVLILTSATNAVIRCKVHFWLHYIRFDKDLSQTGLILRNGSVDCTKEHAQCLVVPMPLLIALSTRPVLGRRSRIVLDCRFVAEKVMAPFTAYLESRGCNS